MVSSVPLHFVHWRQAISQNLDLGWWREHPDDPAFLMPLAHMKLGLETVPLPSLLCGYGKSELMCPRLCSERVLLS